MQLFSQCDILYMQKHRLCETQLPLLNNIVTDFLVAGVPVLFYFEGDRMVAVPFLK